MKIPPQAKKVFTGEIFSVYQWQQQMFDGSIVTFERLKRPDTVMILPARGEKIYLADEEQPGDKRGIGLLGGRIEEGEDVLSAARRELGEEAGMESKDWLEYLCFEPYSKIDWRIYIYLARECQFLGEQDLDAGEKIIVHAYSFAEFIALCRKENQISCQLSNHILRMSDTKLDNFRKLLF